MPYPLYTHTLLSDFNGANENPLSEDGRWASVAGWPASGARVSNQITGSASDFWASRYTVRVFSDFELTIPVTVANNASGNFTIDVGARVLATDGGTPTLSDRNGYFFLWNSAPSLALERMDAGTPTGLASNSGITCTAGDSVGIQCLGSAIKMWHDDGSTGSFAEVLSATSATYTQGWLLVGGFGNVTETAFDNITLGLPTTTLMVPSMRGLGRW